MFSLGWKLTVCCSINAKLCRPLSTVSQWSCALRVQLVAPHRWGNPAGRDGHVWTRPPALYSTLEAGRALSTASMVSVVL